MVKKLQIIKEIQKAIKAADLSETRCGFSVPAGLTLNGSKLSDEEYTKIIIDTTRLYRESWIINPLKEALNLLDKKR